MPTPEHKLTDKDHTHICCLGNFLTCVEEPRCHYPRLELCRNSITDRNLEHVPALVGFSQITLEGQWV